MTVCMYHLVKYQSNVDLLKQFWVGNVQFDYHRFHGSKSNWNKMDMGTVSLPQEKSLILIVFLFTCEQQFKVMRVCKLFYVNRLFAECWNFKLSRSFRSSESVVYEVYFKRICRLKKITFCKNKNLIFYILVFL